jgi:hypothetical protein
MGDGVWLPSERDDARHAAAQALAYLNSGLGRACNTMTSSLQSGQPQLAEVAALHVTDESASESAPFSSGRVLEAGKSTGENSSLWPRDEGKLRTQLAQEGGEEIVVD